MDFLQKELGLKVGIANRGVVHHNTEQAVPLDDWFRIVSETNSFDYVDKTPLEEEIDLYRKCSEKYDLPILCGGWFYTIGADEHLLFKHLENAVSLGTRFHNVQIKAKHVDGYDATNEQIVDIYLRASEYGDRLGCQPCFEIHINMWSEDFLRIFEVAEEIEKRGVPFRMTLDHSHIIFKIDNDFEMNLFDLSQNIQNGSLILDPYIKGNVAQRLINKNYVNMLHARSVIPNNPKNIMASHPDGSFGRGVQYPFEKPLKGQFPSAWDETKLEPWKEVVRQLLNYHCKVESSPLKFISTEFIPATDYGEGNTYSLLRNSIACAKWIKSEIRLRS